MNSNPNTTIIKVRSKKDYDNIRLQKQQEQLKIHNEFMCTVKNFTNTDSKKVPGKLILYFDKKPPNQILKQATDQERINWLKQKKIYTKYTEIYNKLYNKQGIETIQQKITEKELQILEQIQTYITPEQYQNLQNIQQVVQDYLGNITKRTKKTKEQHNLIIENLSQLVSKTHIHLHTLISFRYKHPFTITVPLVGLKDNVHTTEINFCIQELLSLADSLELENTWIHNVTKTLNQKLFDYLQRPEEKISDYININWSKLTSEQQVICLESYAEKYANKYNKNKTQLLKQLKEWHTNKTLVYRYIKWDKTKGIILEIRGLTYDPATEFFILKKPNSNSTSTKSSKIKIDKVKVNKEILKYILALKKQCITLENIQLDKTNFFKFIKTKFDFTLGKDTKLELWNDLNTIYNKLLETETT